MAASMAPPHNYLNITTTRHDSFFKCRSSNNVSLRTTTCSSSSIATSTDSTRLHLANLDNLLCKPSPVPVPHPPENQTGCSRSGRTPESLSEKRLRKAGFNLAHIWPRLRAAAPAAAAEEISPRRLSRLRRLLSMTQEYSPRNNLGSRWREYHGADDWNGLLDPLDENLRREIVKYGELVQAAYKSFHSDPATPNDTELLMAGPPERHVEVPDRSYKVTKSLYATSSIGLPQWVDDVAPDMDWMTQRSSWIGYVAVCDDSREIQRMGRRDIVIALRGTATSLEWAENLRVQQVPIKSNNNDNDDDDDDNSSSNNNIYNAPGQPKVECGFLSLYKTRGIHVPSLAESVVEEVKRLMEQYKGETLSITVTGHSLGAALALLAADELSTCTPEVPPLAVFSFGGPRVGNRAFADRVGANNVKVLRIVNDQDLITRVPGTAFILGEEVEQKLRMAGFVAEDYWDVYSHVGTELRVDTRMSPYLKPDADVACCHDLEAYLHLVDGFSSSECPFRSNAKRSLLRLVREQGPNMKRLYVRKAKALTVNLGTEGQPMIHV